MQIPKVSLKENFPVKELTTYKIGGNARLIFFPTCLDEVIEVYHFVERERLPYFILGGGSNVLVGSGFYNGVVISTTQLNQVQVVDNLVKVQSGVPNNVLANQALDNSLAGVEFLYYLPGYIGGATVMNAKACGQEISDVLKKVTVIKPPDKIVELDKKGLHYRYKHSIFHETDYFLYEITLELEKDNKSLIKEKMEENYNKRKEMFQFDYPSAGCVFKNDYNLGISSGKLIDKLGLKGLNIGDAEVYKHHGNFIINKGSATSDDVLSLINLIKDKVKQQIGVDLECEVQFLGNFDLEEV